LNRQCPDEIKEDGQVVEKVVGVVPKRVLVEKLHALLQRP
jgi:hypothetical protein